MSPSVQPIARLEDPGTVLVLRSQAAVSSDAPCKRELLSRPADADVLGVDFSTPPPTWYDEWCTLLGTAPDNAAVVTTADLAAVAEADEETDYEVETVASPSNLTGVGVKSTPYLSEWDDPVVTVESLTVLLQYVDAQAVYRFLHVLTSRLAASGASGQFYLDPVTQDEQTVDLLKTLFDAVVEYDDGEWLVRTRTA